MQIGITNVPVSLVRAAQKHAKKERMLISGVWIKAMQHYLADAAVREVKKGDQNG